MRLATGIVIARPVLVANIKLCFFVIISLNVYTVL